MKAISTKVAIKSILAMSALAVAGAANATTWDISMNSSVYFPGLGGDLNFTGQGGAGTDFTGTYNDVTGVGTWSGRAFSSNDPTVGGTATALDVSFTQTFVMPTTTHITSGYPAQGTLNPFNVATCHDNLTGGGGASDSACNGFSSPLSGDLFNTVGTSATALATPNAFTPVNGLNMTWTLQVYLTAGKNVVFSPLPLNVTLTAQAGPPPVVTPVPAAAWLFGSGLFGLVGAARRRRSA